VVLCRGFLLKARPIERAINIDMPTVPVEKLKLVKKSAHAQTV
jgi:hypothetical protein